MAQVRKMIKDEAITFNSLNPRRTLAYGFAKHLCKSTAKPMTKTYMDI